jgi:hypothetical protein
MTGVFGTLILSIPVLFGAGVAAADPIPIEGLFNTGVNDAGNALSAGSLEQHYDMSGPAGTARVITPHPVWISAPSGSAWIGPAAASVDSPVGDYTYSIMFDMTGLDIATAMISAQVSSDNSTQVTLNDNLVSFDNGSQGYLTLTDLLIDDGFTNGLNTLSFVVNNEPYSGINPTGLLIANLVGSAMASPHVPEPATAALLALGLTGLALAGRRR